MSFNCDGKTKYENITFCEILGPMSLFRDTELVVLERNFVLNHS